MRRPTWFEPLDSVGEWIGFLGGLVALFLLGSLIAAGIEGFPATNHSDGFPVRFQNDLGQPTILALCHSDHSAICEHPYYRDRISSGGATEENISTDLRTEWAVEDANGKPLRCIVLYWKT